MSAADQTGLEGGSNRVRDVGLSQVRQDYQTRQRRRLTAAWITVIGRFTDTIDLLSIAIFV